MRNAKHPCARRVTRHAASSVTSVTSVTGVKDEINSLPMSDKFEGSEKACFPGGGDGSILRERATRNPSLK